MPEVKEKSLLVLSEPPHIKTGDSIKKIMWTVAAVLMFPALYSVYLFGIHTAMIFAVSIITAVFSGAVFQFLMKRTVKAADGSLVITGLLIGMNVPPDSPVWVSAAGAVFAVVIVKELFGGLGFNIFNPALAARAFMMASWPVYMTAGRHGLAGGAVITEKLNLPGNLPQGVLDVITRATPLAVMKEGSSLAAGYNLPADSIHNFIFNSSILKSLMHGNTNGCIGETSALILLAGGMVLLWRKIITWHIPVSFIGTVALLFYLYYNFIGFLYPLNIVILHLLSGGLILGAVFMATDMVTSPVSSGGKIIFGIGCGLITFAIRLIGGYPEGVAYAILIMNSTVPLIDKVSFRS